MYVTTSDFSEPAQMEMQEDKFPLILINGKRLAQELERATVEVGCTLQELLQRETAWYDANQRPYDPVRILDVSPSSFQTVFRLECAAAAATIKE